MSAACVLGADIGSGSVKLTLLRRDGVIAASAACEYPTYYPQPGFCEQEPEDWCRAFGTALGRILSEAKIDVTEIAALSVDAATHTAVLLDENRRVLRRAILWTDQRSAEQVQRLKEECLPLIQKQALNAPTTVWTLPQLQWLWAHEPELRGRIRHLLFAKDYLRFRLTGTMETDTIDAAGSMFYDVENECWSPELCEVGKIDPAWLPKLCRPTDVAGVVTEEAAREFGLAAGTPVLVGLTDTAAEMLAAGSVEPGHTTVKLATAGRICVITREKLDSPFVFNYRHAVPGLWYPGTATASCAASYRWYRDAIGQKPYSDLNVPAEAISPGSNGLFFHPYLNGELTPYNDPLLRGSYTGISSAHTTAHFTRATLEGVAFSLRQCMDVLRGLGVSMTRTRIIGGGAKGRLWRQIVADVLGIPLEKVTVDDSSLGTAMLAAVGIGWFRDFPQAAEACVQIDSLTEPDPTNREIYEKLYPRYCAIHDVLAPTYHDPP